MPFGLTGAPATFQRFMDVVMSGLNLEVCLVYLNDIIVYSADVDTHLDRLRAVFERLQAAGLKLKPSKCRLFQRRVGFLGQIVSEDGIETDPEKIEAVATWPVQNAYVTVGALSVYAAIIVVSLQGSRKWLLCFMLYQANTHSSYGRRNTSLHLKY